MKNEKIFKKPRVMIENSIAKEWEKVAYNKGYEDGFQAGQEAERKRVDEFVRELKEELNGTPVLYRFQKFINNRIDAFAIKFSEEKN